jgi:hypothetical protein
MTGELRRIFIVTQNTWQLFYILYTCHQVKTLQDKRLELHYHTAHIFETVCILYNNYIFSADASILNISTFLRVFTCVLERPPLFFNHQGYFFNCVLHYSFCNLEIFCSRGYPVLRSRNVSDGNFSIPLF